MKQTKNSKRATETRRSHKKTPYSYFILITFLMVSTFWAAKSEASQPKLFFSDLTSGPKTGWEGSSTKGAAVTVWGLDLGTSGTLTCGGQTLSSSDRDQIAEWGVTTNNAKLDANTTLQRITFWLNSSMSTGSTTITVTAQGQTSNGLGFTVRDLGSNKIYFIAASDGSDSYNGRYSTRSGHTGSDGPWATFGKANPSSNTNIIAGDTIYIRNGTYSGFEWRTGGNIGTATHYISFIGYPSEVPTWSSSIVSVPRPSDGRTTQVDYVVLSKLKKQGNYTGTIGWWGDGWRLIGLYFNITNQRSLWAATINPVNCENTYIYGMKHVGGGYDYYGHVIYPNCGYWEEYRGDIRNFNIAYSEIDNFNGNVGASTGGAALNFRRSGAGAVIDGVYIHNNYMHDSAYAQFLYCGENGGETNYYVYNNLLEKINQYGSDSSRSALFAGFGTNNGTFYAYNNTFYESGKAFSVIWGYDGADWVTKNNIIYESYGYKFVASGSGSVITSDYDCLFGDGRDTYSGGSYTITNEISADPLFVDATGGDFTLRSNSPAIDAGTSDVSMLVGKDLIGNKRPRYSKANPSVDTDYDIGAYEYTVYPTTLKRK